jgi:heavy metal sensor kinase
MFFEKITKFRRSLAFRLTLLYSAIFAISSLLGFFIFYEVVISRVGARTDRALAEEAKELSSLLVSRGTEAFKEEIDREAASAGISDIFFRLLTLQGEEIASSDLSQWKGVGISRIALKHLAQGGPVFETLKPPGSKYKVRVIYDNVGPGAVLQIGQSLRDDEHFFEDMRGIFRTLIAIVFPLVALGGWFMARQSLSGVEKITQTAIAISDGAMERRVPLTGRGDEIDRLSGIFNHMLDRIQSLINEMKEVTDNVAHDIKSPVTRIRGLAEVTLNAERSLDEYQNMAVSTIEECDRLLKMVNTMLEISEDEAGVGSLSFSEVNISALVNDACDLFHPLAEDNGLYVEVNTSAQCLLQGDKSKLQRVIVNLLDNAIKYTPPGGKIIVSVEEVDKKVIISVHDTGMGISSEDLPHIFDRFFRADKSRSVPGAGLGLSLVQAIVRRHRGEIKVSSSPGVGTTFEVVLPLTRTS